MGFLSHSQWLSRKIERDRIKLRFLLLASKREYFPGTEWVEYERLGIWASVNERIALCEGRGGVRTTFLTLDEVIAAENLAHGHSDYTEKFVLRLVEKMFEDE